MMKDFPLRFAAFTSVSLLALCGSGVEVGLPTSDKQFQSIKHIDPAFETVQDEDTTHVLVADSPTEFFQVAQPLPLALAGSCTEILMQHEFSNSYGAPFVADYVPPACDFNAVVIALTVAVRGRQYDRSGVMYLGDTEVWRTTTAEPTPDGIIWHWEKDMTHYLSLWNRSQTLIFDLENIVNDVYTGVLNTTLTATFFLREPIEGHMKPADTIISISKHQGQEGKGSQFVYPEEHASNTVAFPRNANRAVFSVSAKAQGDDEFWWQSLPSSMVWTFNETYGQYPGHSPFREIQVPIDDNLAGIVWPYPTIFTGGVVPSLHKPIVGIDAFDMREHEIDITPWLPLLCDSEEHTFEIRVLGLADYSGTYAELTTEPVENSWYLTGKIFIWLDAIDSITTGTPPDVNAISPQISFEASIHQDGTGKNETLEYTISVEREFIVTSNVKTEKSEGETKWTQSLVYSNHGTVTAYGWDNVNTFKTEGLEDSRGPRTEGRGNFSSRYRYPLFCNSTSAQGTDGGLSIWAYLEQGLDLKVDGDAVFPIGVESYQTDHGNKFIGGQVETTRHTSGTFYRPGDQSTSVGTGTQDQTFDFHGLDESGRKELLYHRDVLAANTTVLRDVETTDDG